MATSKSQRHPNQGEIRASRCQTIQELFNLKFPITWELSSTSRAWKWSATTVSRQLQYVAVSLPIFVLLYTSANLNGATSNTHLCSALRIHKHSPPSMLNYQSGNRDPLVPFIVFQNGNVQIVLDNSFTPSPMP